MAERIIKSGQKTGNQRHLEVGWATLVPALYSLGDFEGVFFYLDRLREAHGGYVDQVGFDQWLARARANSWVSLWLAFLSRERFTLNPLLIHSQPTAHNLLRTRKIANQKDMRPANAMELAVFVPFCPVFWRIRVLAGYENHQSWVMPSTLNPVFRRFGAGHKTTNCEWCAVDDYRASSVAFRPSRHWSSPGTKTLNPKP